MRIIRRFTGQAITSKEMSKRLIEELGLNTVDNMLVTTVDSALEAFLAKHPLVGVRFMEFGRPSQYGLNKADATKFLRENLPRFKQFRVEQSLKAYDAGAMLLQGEFMWDGTCLEGMYCIERGHSLKEINTTGRPITPLVEHNWRFRRVKDVMMLHDLRGVVAEMTFYTKPVGVYDEDYVCWELRNQY